ncbi:MAG: hypothetical protein K2P99_04475, partial [Burkholderiales bacterium]|nr:hypothetical protein [Burkholderiales bacterium]
MENEVDIYIIQKQTALQRYSKKYPNIDFLDYLEKDGQSIDRLKYAHDEHMKSKEYLLECLNNYHLSYKIYNLDEISETYTLFYNDKQQNSGLNPKKNLVVALGGDGTLLHASHYVGGSVTLLGINSCPAHSVGHLCAIHTDKIKSFFELFLQNQLPIEKARRLKIKTSNGQYLPLALNDILI